jgi:anaerobic selenocysteine-containing dehydrogenase
MDCRRASFVTIAKNDGLLCHLQRLLIKSGHIDEAYIAAHTVSFDDVKQAVEPYTPAEVERITGEAMTHHSDGEGNAMHRNLNRLLQVYQPISWRRQQGYSVQRLRLFLQRYRYGVAFGIDYEYELSFLSIRFRVYSSSILDERQYLQGVYQSHQATAAACAINNIHLMRGMLGKPGCGLLQVCKRMFDASDVCVFLAKDLSIICCWCR